MTQKEGQKVPPKLTQKEGQKEGPKVTPKPTQKLTKTGTFSGNPRRSRSDPKHAKFRAISRGFSTPKWSDVKKAPKTLVGIGQKHAISDTRADHTCNKRARKMRQRATNMHKNVAIIPPQGGRGKRR